MDPRTFPTKGNLILAKNSLNLANQGFELMDKKKEYPDPGADGIPIEQAKDIQSQIDTTFSYAYRCLQHANVEHGISYVQQLAYTIPIEDSIKIQTRSIMGTEIPHVKYTPTPAKPSFSFSTTKESIVRCCGRIYQSKRADDRAFHD